MFKNIGVAIYVTKDVVLIQSSVVCCAVRTCPDGMTQIATRVFDKIMEGNVYFRMLPMCVV